MSIEYITYILSFVYRSLLTLEYITYENRMAHTADFCESLPAEYQ